MEQHSNLIPEYKYPKPNIAIMKRVNADIAGTCTPAKYARYGILFFFL